MKPKVLVADDEEGIREALNLILGKEYTIEFAKDGEEALMKIGVASYELVLLDIKMPKRDGLEVLRQLKGMRIEVPVLVLATYQSVELAKQAVKLGALDYLPKPFEREQILNAVKTVLANR